MCGVSEFSFLKTIIYVFLKQFENFFAKVPITSFFRLLKGFRILGFSIDESVTEQLLKCFVTMTLLSCRLGHAAGRDAAYFALCKAALPRKYLVRIANASGGLTSLSGPLISSNSHFERDSLSGMLSKIQLLIIKFFEHSC